MSFLGTYEHTVDAKGRVSLPAKHRKELPDEVIIVPVPNEDFGKALYVFSDEVYGAWVDSFFKSEAEGGTYNPRSKRHIAMRRYLDASAEQVPIDSVGRVKLSAKQCEKVGIVKDVTIVGQNDHIEIWDPQTYVAYMGSTDPFAPFVED